MKVPRDEVEHQERSQCLPFETSQAQLEQLSAGNSCQGLGFAVSSTRNMLLDELIM